jgi:hypothetical protein
MFRAAVPAPDPLESAHEFHRMSKPCPREAVATQLVLRHPVQAPPFAAMKIPSTIPHMSLAPPALETPSRFAAGTSTRAPRSRRVRTLRGRRRAAAIALLSLAVAFALASMFGSNTSAAFAARVWSHF